MIMNQQTVQQRQTAYIVRIKDLINGTLVKEDGWNPNYVVVGNKKVSRINIIGVVIDVKEQEKMQNVVIDDGTGKITIRCFEKRTDAKIGEVMLVVGRIRQYGNEKYITPEIMKKNIDKRWNSLWKKHSLKNESSKIDSIPEKMTEEKIEEEKIGVKSDVERIISKIKELDDGNGASYNEVINLHPDKEIISRLLIQGEIFEIKPGKLKVLD